VNSDTVADYCALCNLSTATVHMHAATKENTGKCRVKCIHVQHTHAAIAVCLRTVLSVIVGINQQQACVCRCMHISDLPW
jgi:hypothetical protein